MSCGLFELWVVSDDPQEQAQAQRHARECERCAEILRGQKRLLDQTVAWAGPIQPSPELEQRIRAAIEKGSDELAARREIEQEKPGLAHWRLWAGALAASLVVGLGVGLLQGAWAPLGPEEADRLLVAEALQDAADAEREHAKAIARLESAVAPILARASDPEFPAHQASILLAYRDRLAYLDATIIEIDSFVELNPGHPGARTTLLAAYKEKTEVLREVLALEERS